MLKNFSKNIPSYINRNIVPQRFQYLFIETPKPLGRWSIDGNEDVRATFANHDSCGDKLCGDPLLLRENINNIKTNNSIFKEKNTKI